MESGSLYDMIVATTLGCRDQSGSFSSSTYLRRVDPFVLIVDRVESQVVDTVFMTLDVTCVDRVDTIELSMTSMVPP